MRRFALVTSWFLLTLAGCGDGSDVVESGGVVEPDLVGKSDVSDRVQMKGLLRYDEAATAEITEDFEFHGYVLKAEPGARVTVETTHKGSNADMDTTLFIYGPDTGSGFGGQSIVRDNDDGWGRLSRIDDFLLEKGGRYLVVVGTPTATGRGRYRLLATCPGGGCTAQTPDLATDSCPDEVEENLLDCISETQHDLGVGRDYAMSVCFDEIDVVDMFEGLCWEDAFTTPPAWCTQGDEAFSEGFLPSCTDKITDDFSIEVQDLGLASLALNAELEEVQEAAWGTCDDYCQLAVHAFTYQTDASINAIVDAMHRTIEFENASWYNEGETTATRIEDMASDLGLGDVIVPAQKLAGTQDFVVGLGTYQDTPWASVDAYGTVFVMIFAQTKTLVVFDLVSFSE